VFPGLDAEGEPFSSADAGTSSGQASSPCFRLSYTEFDAQVDRVARSLLALKIGHGDHVAVWATNWPQWVLLQLATARIGAVMVTTNPAYRSSELAYVLKQSDARALFLIDRFRNANYFDILTEAETDDDSQQASAAGQKFPKLAHRVAIRGEPPEGILPWNEFLQLGATIDPQELTAREKILKAEDPINVQYTSGTTGFPKGAMLTHRNLLLNAFYVGGCQRISEQDRICIPVPFYHCFGCVLGVLCSAVFGAAMIVPAEYFDATATLEAIAKEGATSLYGVPTMFISQLEHPEFARQELSSLRTGIMAGSPCPVEVMQRVIDDMGAREITIAYGLTEASPVITQTRTEDPVDLRVKTVGCELPGVEVKLVDPATGDRLGDNEQGELCTRGHVVMRGYYNMPDATAGAIDADGWLHTGDLAMRMPNGYYRITGRIKDMICRGGENIYPREIEEFLYTHPAIEDVAVVGVPDPKFVEEVAAWIRLKQGASTNEEEIREFCKKQMAHFKVPRYVRFVDAFPQTVTGKIQKFKIRELIIEELGLAETETA
jgi:fatty-acyl-CoA synthase